MSETDWRRNNTPNTNEPPPWGVQRYVEEPMRYLDNPEPGWAPPSPPTPASTWAFTLSMLAAVLGLFNSAINYHITFVAMVPGIFFLVRSILDGRRGVRQNPVLLGLATLGLVVAGICGVWGYNTMQDVQDGLDCIENSETLYDMGQC